MQDAPYHSPAHDMAADGLPMENHWTSQDFMLQPYATEQGGIGKNRYTGRPPHGCEAAFSRIGSPEQRDKDHHASLGPYNVASSEPPFLAYTCQYPGCFAVFFEQWMLDTHCKVHANYPDSTVTATLRSDGPTNGSGRPQPRHLDLITPDVYGRFVEGLSTGTFNDTIAAAAMYTPQSNPSAGHEDHSIDGAAVGGNPLPTSPSSVSPTSLSLSGRFHCSHQGCTTSCARPADLRRHALKHSAGARAFGCPNAGCPRKGSRAFDRKDKMLSHSKVCRAGARTGGSETQEA